MTFHLSISSPEQMIFEGEVHSLFVPGSAGLMEILPHHAPLLTTLQAGKITLYKNHEPLTFSVTGGLLEVQNNQAIILIT